MILNPLDKTRPLLMSSRLLILFSSWPKVEVISPCCLSFCNWVAGEEKMRAMDDVMFALLFADG